MVVPVPAWPGVPSPASIWMTPPATPATVERLEHDGVDAAEDALGAELAGVGFFVEGVGVDEAEVEGRV